MVNKIKDVLLSVKSSAKRELGIFFVMTIFALIAAVIAIPVILVLGLIPDWGFWAISIIALIWFVFQETIAAAIKTFRENK